MGMLNVGSATRMIALYSLCRDALVRDSNNITIWLVARMIHQVQTEYTVLYVVTRGVPTA
jgi:hypothetical protein